MRRAARVDGNHREIVAALVGIGCAVESLAAIGKGFPDLLWMRAGCLGLIEVKNPAMRKSDRQLTPDQVRFHAVWGRCIDVVETADQAIAAVKRRVL